MAIGLAMPLFISISDVINRMQLNDALPGIDDVVSSAISGAELEIEKIMDSQLSRQSLDCTFYLDKTLFSGIQPNGIFRLEMPCSFIRKDTPVKVLCSTQTNVDMWSVFNNIEFMSDDMGPFETYDDIDTSLIRVDYRRGYIFVAAAQYANRYVRVQCDTGFEPGTNLVPVSGQPQYDPTLVYNPGDFVLFNSLVYLCLVQTVAGTDPSNNDYWALAVIAMEQVPMDLYESIMSLVPSVFDSSQATNRNPEVKEQVETSSDRALILLSKYMRKEGFSIRPMFQA
jgi:hypothetical protein